MKPRTLHPDDLKLLLGFVSQAQQHFADASGAIAHSPEAGTWNRARRSLLDGLRALNHARAILDVATEPSSVG